MTPSTRAWLATIVFAAVGGVGFFIIAPDSKMVWPNLIFYVIIVINTFFSVRLFAALAPPRPALVLIDVVLVVAYFALGLSIGREWAFPFFALLVFVAAPVKYVLMLGHVPHTEFLRRKLLIDLGGTALCALALLSAILLGYPLASAWALAIIFTIANIYLLLIRPMYRL